MPFGSLIIGHNPVVVSPPAGTFNLGLYPVGVTRIDPNSYVHIIRDMAGFFSCKFDILGPESILGELMDNGLGREVRTYNHYGVKAWEGVITTMRMSTRSAQRLETLEQMANKIKVRVSIDRISGQQTANVENAASQANYGIFEMVEELGYLVTIKTRGDTLANILEKDLSDPHRQKEFRDKGDPSIPAGMAKLTVFCSGYYFYLTRRFYSAHVRANANTNVVISAIISSVGDFVNTSSIATNTQQVWQRYDNDDMAWDVIATASRTGDTSDNRFVVGMYDERSFIYEQRVSPTLPNISVFKDGDNRISDKTGRPIAGMLLRANTYMRNVSVANRTGKVYSDIWDDPQVTYIASVTYRENGQKVKVETEAQVSSARPGSVTAFENADLDRFFRSGGGFSRGRGRRW